MVFCAENQFKSGGLLWCSHGPDLLRLYLVAEFGGYSVTVVEDYMLGCLTTFCEFLCLYDFWIYDDVNQSYEGDFIFLSPNKGMVKVDYWCCLEVAMVG